MQKTIPKQTPCKIYILKTFILFIDETCIEKLFKRCRNSQKCIFSTFFLLHFSSSYHTNEGKNVFSHFFFTETKNVLPSFSWHAYIRKKIFCLQNLSVSFEIQIYNLLSILYILYLSFPPF